MNKAEQILRNRILELRFSEYEYDAGDEPRFVARRPDGWSYRSDPLGCELWLVTPDGMPDTRLRNGRFVAETLEQFEDEVVKQIVTDIERSSKIDTPDDKETRTAVLSGLRTLFALVDACWDLMMFVSMIFVLLIGAVVVGTGVLLVIPLWIFCAIVLGGLKGK